MSPYNPSAGVLVHHGAGGFLKPPTHPEHEWSIETDQRRRTENRGFMSLSYAATCDYTDAATRARAKRKLAEWQAPPIDSPEVQEWILQVLGYFRNCYRGEGAESECWNAGNLRIAKPGDPLRSVDESAGVHFVRAFYPGFTPTEQQQNDAYWGTKPERATLPPIRTN